MRRRLGAVRGYVRRRRLYGKAPREVFEAFYRHDLWHGRSMSGRGSDPDQTRELVRRLPELLSRFEVRSVLDIPCGDFSWMQNVDRTGWTYVGADIVPDLVEANQQRFGGDGVRFVELDLIRDPLPAAECILCRDCLVHLSTDDIWGALQNMVAAEADYLLLTTFVSRDANPDIATGMWRPLNMQAPPFNLPAPVAVLTEGCTEADGQYWDKSLGLWQVSDVSRVLASPTRGR